MNANPLIAVTGGPGAGKTTLVDALADEGFATVPEAGRAILEEQKRSGGSATHDGDRVRYAELQFQRCIADYEAALTLPPPVWFDRTIVDVYGYYLLIGEAVPDRVKRACDTHRYAKDALLAPFWPDIFCNDELRRQDEAEARATENALREAYTANGYQLVELSKASIADRVAFAVRRFT
ncbi:MAG: AAA family ATPase [Parasphingopyxis sp.]|uniref:AAA family ATPase n=1 Tax=Parasphingopyxis sp. TaxID=1920299 RepID=UPI003F9F90B8